MPYVTVATKPIYESYLELLMSNIPDYVKVEVIETADDSWQVIIHNRIWVNKVVPMHPTYSKEFTKQEVLKDMALKILNKLDIAIVEVDRNWAQRCLS